MRIKAISVIGVNGKFVIFMLFLVLSIQAKAIDNIPKKINILEVYKSIPLKFLPSQSEEERQERIKKKWLNVDLRNGFLEFNSMTVGESFGMTLFKMPGGDILVVVLKGGCDDFGQITDKSRLCRIPLTFIKMTKKNWIDVTNEVLPSTINPKNVKPNLFYVLPKKGKIIEVWWLSEDRETSKHLYNLVPSGNQFVAKSR
jgi:hypothetical protein